MLPLSILSSGNSKILRTTSVKSDLTPVLGIQERLWVFSNAWKHITRAATVDVVSAQPCSISGMFLVNFDIGLYVMTFQFASADPVL